MVHVMAVIRLQAEHIEKAVVAMAELAVQSRAEQGCLRYEVFRQEGEAVLVTQETWADASAEAAHMSGPNVAQAFAKVGQFLAAPPDIRHYTQIA